MRKDIIYIICASLRFLRECVEIILTHLYASFRNCGKISKHIFFFFPWLSSPASNSAATWRAKGLRLNWEVIKCCCTSIATEFIYNLQLSLSWKSFHISNGHMCISNQRTHCNRRLFIYAQNWPTNIRSNRRSIQKSWWNTPVLWKWFATDFFVSNQTLRLMLKPSSVIWKRSSLSYPIKSKVTRSLRAWPCNSCSRDAFVGFWKYNVIVPSVWVHSRVPGFKEKSLVVIWFDTKSLDVWKVHVMAELVDMACNFGVLVKTCHCLFELRNSCL